MNKWNFKTMAYEPYKLPEGAIRFSTDMSKECNCAQCGKRMVYGDGYTSLEVHDDFGFGYAVCPECYELEMDRKLEAEKRETKAHWIAFNQVFRSNGKEEHVAMIECSNCGSQFESVDDLSECPCCHARMGNGDDEE